jgi:hypothetical protein
MRLSRFAGVLLVLAIACSGSPQGCTGCGPAATAYPDPPPPGGEVLPGGARARLTTGALDFLEHHLGALLAAFLVVEGDRGVYPLDEAAVGGSTAPLIIRDGCIGEPDLPCAPRDGDPAAELGPTYRSTVAFDLAALSDGLSLAWLPPDGSGRPGLHLAVSELDLFVDLAFVTNITALGAAACHAQDTPGYAALRLKELSFDLRLGVDTVGPSPRLTSSTENVLVDLGQATDDSALHLTVTACDGVADPGCDDPRCHGAYGDFPATDCQEVCGLFDLFAQLGGFLTAVLDPVLDTLAPSLAAAVSDALVGGLGAVPLGVETEVDLAALTGGLIPAAEPLRLKATLDPVVGVRGELPGRGLETAFNVGFTTPTPAVCAANAIAPDFMAATGAPPDYTGFVEIFDAMSGTSRFEAYHAAISIAEATLSQALFAAFQGGLLCFNLTSQQVAALAGGAFELNAGLLMNFDARLAGIAEPSAPLMLGLWASRAPTIRLGAGGDIGGVADPLVEIAVTELGVDIFVELDHELVRLAGIVADVVVRLGVDRAPGGILELVVKDVTLVDSRQIYNELAPDADLSSLLKLIVDLALGQLLAGSQRFPIDVTNSLGSALGVPLYVRLNALRRDLGPSGAAFLSAYATLCDEAEIGDPRNLTCYLPKLGLGVIPRLGASVVTSPATTRGRATLALSVEAAVPLPWVFQTRVDKGPWSHAALAVGGRLEISSPRLLVAGAHVVEIRARLPENDTLASEPVALEIDVPPIAWVRAAPLADSGALPTESAGPFGCQTTPTDPAVFVAIAALVRRRRPSPPAVGRLSPPSA